MAVLPDIRLLGAETDFDWLPGQEPNILWGVAPTGAIHLGYVPILYLLRNLGRHGAKPIVLIANYHGYWDSHKTDWQSIKETTEYYKATFADVGFPDCLETNTFYTQKKYIEELFEFAGHCRIKDVLLAGATTLKASADEASISDVLYVATQVLDVKFLNVSLVMCGQDEAPIYRYGLNVLKAHYGVRCSYLYMPHCPGLTQVEMHASDPATNKILIEDDLGVIRTKIALMFAEGRNRNHPLIQFCIKTLFPVAGRPDVSNILREQILNNDKAVPGTLATAIHQVLVALRSPLADPPKK